MNQQGEKKSTVSLKSIENKVEKKFKKKQKKRSSSELARKTKNIGHVNGLTLTSDLLVQSGSVFTVFWYCYLVSVTFCKRASKLTTKSLVQSNIKQ